MELPKTLKKKQLPGLLPIASRLGPAMVVHGVLPRKRLPASGSIGVYKEVQKGLRFRVWV